MCVSRDLLSDSAPRSTEPHPPVPLRPPSSADLFFGVGSAPGRMTDRSGNRQKGHVDQPQTSDSNLYHGGKEESQEVHQDLVHQDLVLQRSHVWWI